MNSESIAIIGLAGQFPEAKNINKFWQNLANGVESIRFFSEEELLAAGIKADTLANPAYVNGLAMLDDVDKFDARFFDYRPRQAKTMDPQHRLFMQCVWTALEHAGYDPERTTGPIGLYAGVGANRYLTTNLYPSGILETAPDAHQIILDNHSDFFTTRVSYKLNLQGPSVTMLTACSTSLVATHFACQSLLNGECDLALAGGAGISLPQVSGYLYQEGGILAVDGHCRPFDRHATGTVRGNGLGVVVLKRVDDALAEGDYIWGLILGSAINNDGSLKVGYTAPSVVGQAAVISEALAIADVPPETITYIETHGTATPLGDPIEIAALKEAFAAVEKKDHCALGAVKSNIGHLDTAAGVAGLIKTILTLKHQQIPPTLHFQEPNPNLGLAESPFYVNTTLQDWVATETPRRAGVSSFGIGGTNAHLILEEAPAIDPSGPSREQQHLMLSAKTETALAQITHNLAGHLKTQPDLNLADVAYTLQVGRQPLPYRQVIPCQNISEAIAGLEEVNDQRLTNRCETDTPKIVFMFSGQGSQYVNMGRALYHNEPVFQDAVDACAEILAEHLKRDLRDLLYPTSNQIEAASQKLNQTMFTQPALFTIEYALAQLWQSWGILPQAMIGHSIGEYVAAHLAGVFNLEDALRLVATRGKLMQSLPEGRMLTISRPAEEIEAYLPNHLSIAVINNPKRCVVAGPAPLIADFEKELKSKKIACRQLHTSHAFHSPMMAPILPAFIETFNQISLSAPTQPYISNVSGTWITTEEATNSQYWGEHLRQTVQFSNGLAQICSDPQRILLEVGPGNALTTLAKQHPARPKAQSVLASLPAPKKETPADTHLLYTLATLWTQGVIIDWPEFYNNETRQRLPLPTYPFEGKRYWIEPQPKPTPSPANQPEREIQHSVAEAIPVQPGVETSPLDGPHANNKTAPSPLVNPVSEVAVEERIIAQQLEIIAQQLALLAQEG